MQLDPRVPAVVQLADEQLRAYNRRDLDAFCACYAEDVTVLDQHGAVRTQGLAAFREQYGKLFAEQATPAFRADITGRVQAGHHLVEHEIAYRMDAATAHVKRLELLVRYTERDGKIQTVQFFMVN